jgi:hypothetical protein
MTPSGPLVVLVARWVRRVPTIRLISSSRSCSYCSGADADSHSATHGVMNDGSVMHSCASPGTSSTTSKGVG